MAIDYDGDIDFGESCTFSFSEMTTRTPEYALISQTFRTSLQRVISLGWLPAEMAYWSALFASTAAEAKRRLGKDIFSEPNASDVELMAMFRSVFAQISPFAGGNMVDAGNQIFKIGSSRIKTILQEDELLANTTSLRVSGLEAVLAAMITSGYAAVETLANDLWVAALNRHSQLAKNYVEKSGEKQILLAVASGYNFDMSQSMGKVLTETKKVSFQSFYDIKTAFENAFGDQLPNIFDNVKGVHLAEKIRHLIAHRGGLVDSKFKQDVKDFPAYSD